MWCALWRTSPNPMRRRRCLRLPTASKQNFNSAARATPRKEVRKEMKNRREFLKESATGALLLGSQSVFPLSRIITTPTGHLKPKVVVARDPELHGQSTQPDERRVLDLLDRAMAAYTGKDKPAEGGKKGFAWAPPGNRGLG